jgi:tetratricopeptide (TPR) repeat protein
LDGTDIEAIRQDLAKLEKAEFDTQVQTNYDEAYQWPLGLALMVLLLELLIRERKTDKSLWRGRWISNMVPNRMSKRRKNAATSATLSLFILISPIRVWAQSPMTAYKNLEGVKALQAERPYKAYQNFTEALKDESSNEALQFNLGTSLYANKEVEKSEKQFKASAESAQSEKIQFLSWFNAGVAAGEQKKVPAALEYYQRALALNPASKEVKTNIELLLQQQSGGGESDDKDKNTDKNTDKNKDKNKDKDKKDGKGDQDKDDKKDQDKQDEKKPKPSPKPFKSEELTERDVKNILEELKRQEQQIRGRLNDRKSKDQDPDKDW